MPSRRQVHQQIASVSFTDARLTPQKTLSILPYLDRQIMEGQTMPTLPSTTSLPDAASARTRPEPVTDGQVEILLQAAGPRRRPNRQPWHFVVVRDASTRAALPKPIPTPRC